MVRLPLALLFGIWGYTLANCFYWIVVAHEAPTSSGMATSALLLGVVAVPLLVAPILVYGLAGPWKTGRALLFLLAFVLLMAAAGALLVSLDPNREAGPVRRPWLTGLIALAGSVALHLKVLRTRSRNGHDAKGDPQGSGTAHRPQIVTIALWATVGVLGAVVRAVVYG